MPTLTRRIANLEQRHGGKARTYTFMGERFTATSAELREMYRRIVAANCESLESEQCGESEPASADPRDGGAGKGTDLI